MLGSRSTVAVLLAVASPRAGHYTDFRSSAATHQGQKTSEGKALQLRKAETSGATTAPVWVGGWVALPSSPPPLPLSSVLVEGVGKSRCMRARGPGAMVDPLHVRIQPRGVRFIPPHSRLRRPPLNPPPLRANMKVLVPPA